MDYRDRIRSRYYQDGRRPPSDRLGGLGRDRRDAPGYLDDYKRSRPTGRERRLEGRLGRRETFDSKNIRDSHQDDYDMGPSTRDRDIEMLYVLRIGNLEESVRDTTMEETLYHIFKKFGRITVRVAGLGKSRHAFVNFESHDAAQDAHSRCQEMFVFDKPLRIEWCSKSTRDQDLSYKRSPLYMEDDFDSHNSVNRYVRNRRLSPPSFPSGRAGSPQVSPSRTLLIGNLDSDVSASELRRVFSRYGHLIDLDIKLNRFTKCAYAQVKYSLNRDAIFAREAMNNKHVGVSRLYITFSKGMPTTKLVVRGIANRGDAQELEREFSRYGPLRRMEYLNNTSYCFLTFESIDSCYAAIVDWRGRKLRSGGNNLRVDFSRSGAIEDKRRRPSRSARGIYEGEIIIKAKPRRKSSPGSHIPRRQRSLDRLSPAGDYPSKSSYRKRPHRSSDDESYKHNKYKRRSHDRERQESLSRDLDQDLGDDCDFNDAASSWDEHRSQRSLASKYSMEDHVAENEGDADSLRDRRDSEVGVGDLDGLVDEIAEPTEYEGPSIEKFAGKYPAVWYGAFMLKNTAFPTQMHLINGEEKVVEELMKGSESTHQLRVTQRLRLESTRLEEVNKRLSGAGSDGHALLLALPNANGQEQVLPADSNYRPIRSLVNYLKQKDAAGIVALSGTQSEEQNDNISKEEGETGVNTPGPDSEMTGVLHAFPPCNFSHELLQQAVPDLGDEQFREDHIVVLVVKGSV